MLLLFVQVHQLKPCHTQTMHESVLGVSIIFISYTNVSMQQYVAIVKITVKLYAAISNHH